MIDFSTPLQGIHSVEARLDTTASQIARASLPSGQPQSSNDKDTVQLSSDMVALMREREEFEANLKAMQAQNQMLIEALQRMG